MLNEINYRVHINFYINCNCCDDSSEYALNKKNYLYNFFRNTK